tara:strand:- start:19 stop:213 length:195 start_codon:yes stop_codon:yes gene_type:complete
MQAQHINNAPNERKRARLKIAASPVINNLYQYATGIGGFGSVIAESPAHRIGPERPILLPRIST